MANSFKVSQFKSIEQIRRHWDELELDLTADDDILMAALKHDAALVGAATRELDAMRWMATLPERYSRRIRPVPLDLTNHSTIRDAVETATSSQVVINNAAVCFPGSPLTLSAEKIRLEWETNFFGPVRLIRTALSSCNGLELIANIGSKYRYFSLPAIGNYCATKAALASIAGGIRYELSSRNVRIQTFFPGALDTQMSASFRGPKTSPEIVAESIVARLGCSEDEVAVTSDAIDMIQQYHDDPRAVRRQLEDQTYTAYFNELE